ncbi:unnamed protein product [Vitrella brassicaformis CCMP3155]|uniref:TPX2 C-terminal domain-containing protein n=3 Tax=Vitrella brassicaformis TaxID=1169539 RepID=A0A0G4GKM9_VITBC|nr:unnamed protein product [Vitrella brassicaformis CCMP3155]|eukprot:CEM30576.1 unnamed protein product [Vitrella brassicaformis CCMP3155]
MEKNTEEEAPQPSAKVRTDGEDRPSNTTAEEDHANGDDDAPLPSVEPKCPVQESPADATPPADHEQPAPPAADVKQPSAPPGDAPEADLARQSGEEASQSAGQGVEAAHQAGEAAPSPASAPATAEEEEEEEEVTTTGEEKKEQKDYHQDQSGSKRSMEDGLTVEAADGAVLKALRQEEPLPLYLVGSEAWETRAAAAQDLDDHDAEGGTGDAKTDHADHDKHDTASLPAALPHHRKLTNPHSPRFATSARLRGTSEESRELQEQREIHKGRTEAARLRQLNEKSLPRVLAGVGGQAMKRSVKPLTMPQEFALSTDVRLGPYQPSPSHADRHRKAATHYTGKPTPAVPFRFATEMRVREMEGAGGGGEGVGGGVGADGRHTPLADTLREFERSLRGEEAKGEGARGERGKGGGVAGGGKLTCPQPFNLHTEQLPPKPPRFVSREEQEADEMAKMPPFRARPLNPKVLRADRPLGVPHVPPPQLTDPVTPPLAAFKHKKEGSRMDEGVGGDSKEGVGGGGGDGGAGGQEGEELAAHFKARPLNKKMLERPLFEPKVGSRDLTNPQSPPLATKGRAKPIAQSEVDHGSDREHVSVASGAGVGVGKPTVPRAFQLATEQRGQHYRHEFEVRVAHEEQEHAERRKVKANPVPTNILKKGGSSLRSASVDRRPLTAPKPFDLSSEHRHEYARREFQKQVDAQERKKREQASFKARPYIPKPPPAANSHGVGGGGGGGAGGDKGLSKSRSIHLTETLPFNLAVDSRNAKWREMEARRAAKEAAAEAERKKKQSEEAQRLREERAALRAEAVPKAKPAPVFHPPPPVRRSDKPLTVPQAPKFHTGARTSTHRHDSGAGGGDKGGAGT